MASQGWLESSLRRSASLGLEVLERASRRSVDWPSTGAVTPATIDEDTQIPVTVRACFLYTNTIICNIRILTPLLCLISALSILVLLSFSREYTASSKMSLQPSQGSWHRRPISARSAIILLAALWFQLQTGETKLWIFSVLQRFYESGCCTEPTDTERTHVSRFHTRPAAGKSTSALPTRKHLRAPYNKVSESNTILHPIVIVFPTNLC